MEKSIEEVMLNRIIHSEIFSQLSTKTDDYDEKILGKLLNKIKCAKEIAERFDLDTNIVEIVMIGEAISYPCYGKIGEEFLKSKENSFSKLSFAVAIMKKMINKIDDVKMDSIYIGIENVINNNPITAEEQLVLLINKVFEEIDSIKEKDIRAVLVGLFMSKVIENGKIEKVEYIDKKINLEKREYRSLSKEEKTRELEEAYQYYFNNYNELKDFKLGLENLTKEAIVAYYIATRTQREIELIKSKR